MNKLLRFMSFALVLTVLIMSICTVATASSPKPVIILKFDDLTAKNVAGFQRVFDILMEEKIDGGFGIIGNSLDGSGATQEYYDKIKQWHDAGVEIWHHGYSHTEPEYHGSDFDTQYESFNKTVTLLEEKCGITVTCFGSPYNNSDETTIKMINEKFPQITTILLAADKNNEANAAVLPVRSNIEPKTGVVSYDGFVSEYAKNKRSPYMVLQGHPAGWTENDISEFRKVIAFLKEKGCTFMTPTEAGAYYKNYIANPPALDYVDVMVNGSYIDFDNDTEPAIINDRVVVPFRKIFAALEAEVSWDEATRTATAKGANTTVKITEDSTTAYINGEAAELDVAATIIDGRFVVPIRFVSEALDKIVYWDGEKNTVVIASKTAKAESLPEGAAEIKDCTFSSYFEDELGYMSYDGDKDTLWSCSGTSQWVCYDLGEKSDISKVSIMWNKGDARKARFKIEVSDDKESFTALFDGEASGASTDFEDYDVSGSGRYVRIYCMGNNTSEWNAIKEIVIYK